MSSSELLAAQIAQIAAAINSENYAEAQTLCVTLEQMAPEHPQLYYFRGAIASGQGEFETALEQMHRAVALGPENWYEPDFFLGKIYRQLGRQVEAIAHFSKVTQKQPAIAEAWFLLSGCYSDAGQMQTAYPLLQEALQRIPQHLGYQNELLFFLPAMPGMTDGQRKQIYQQWALAHAGIPRASRVYANTLEPTRRLRIGYVSADFRQHAAANNLYPLFKHANRDQFEIFAYAHNALPDTFTEWFQEKSDHWLEVQDLTDQQLAERIAADQIDILVDCSGHTAGNRLRALASKPAPIQISAFGFVFTTGMKAIDYQFSDAIATPPVRAKHFTENLIHLPSQIHWAPLTPEVRDLPLSTPPSERYGYITFGSGNGAFKHNEYVIKLWAAILKQLPTSRLHLKHRKFGEVGIQAMVQKSFKAEGVAPERIQFSGHTPMLEHMAFYQDIDIALDPFPYTGGMTTCETLYMGVPLIALDGDGVRTSPSLLTLTGASELLAKTPEEYVFKAVALARSPQRLAGYRQSLRSQMQHSPIMRGKTFAREVETAYRKVWERWCQQQKARAN